MEIRILEVDATPLTVPSEVEKMLEPILAAAQIETQLKAGELPDADWPSRHSSYYVGFRYHPDTSSESRAVEKWIDEITRYCRSQNLPIIEITPHHREFHNLVAQLNWV